MKWRNDMKKMMDVQNWNLKKKLIFFISIVVSLTSIVSLIISITFTVHSSIKQAKELAQTQLDMTSKHFEDTINNYYDLAVAAIITKDIQTISTNKGISTDELYRVRGRVQEKLEEILNLQSNINFIAVRPYHVYGYIYSGRTSITDSKFEQQYIEDIQKSIPTKKDSKVRMSISRSYFGDDRFTVTFYYPIYSAAIVNKEQGMLVINFSDQILQSIEIADNEKNGSEMYMMGMDGTKRFSSMETEFEQQALFYSNIVGKSQGSFFENGTLVLFQQIQDWNYYLVKEIPLNVLYKASIQMAIVLAIVLIIMLVMTILVIRKMISNFHQPINEVVHAMNHVANKQLNIKVSATMMDSDSRTLVEGFNQMIHEINQLIEQVKTEQKQMEQIRFHTLQSQIRPHFLYNTLDCIHWQALADDSEEIATMVEALAKYYRVCLSEGQEIISFEEEITHVESYVTIQNMRYDNIIELIVERTGETDSIKVPKLTLQPLIENSIYHGMRVKEGHRGRITIKTIQEKQQVRMIVSDNGQGMSPEKVKQINESLKESSTTIGYGIQNVNKRIELLFGETYGLHYSINDSGGITVDISLPIMGGRDDV